MRLMFLYHLVEDRGSAQDIYEYARVAARLGHDVNIYGRGPERSRFPYSVDVAGIEALIFVVEWTTRLQYGDAVDFARLAARVPRRRRVVIDCDGRYNDRIAVRGDVNHRDEAESRRWTQTCDSLADKICQPTLHPLRPGVRSFLFHGYSPDWEVPLTPGRNPCDLVYVGNNWFRWRGLQRILRALEAVRERVGRVVIVGHGWDRPAPWAAPGVPEEAYHTEPEYLKRLGVEVLPPVSFAEVIRCMSQGVCHPVVYRPLFDRLQLVTCRTFETLAANTIPLFAQDADLLTEIYGPAAVELRLPSERPEEKLLDVLRRPAYYAEKVRMMRRRLATEHSYDKRLKDLLEIVEA